LVWPYTKERGQPRPRPIDSDPRAAQRFRGSAAWRTLGHPAPHFSSRIAFRFGEAMKQKPFEIETLLEVLQSLARAA
jgi:hypothetical protein